MRKRLFSHALVLQTISQDQRLVQLDQLHDKISTNDAIDAQTVAPAFGTKENHMDHLAPTATTSQVHSEVQQEVWIDAALELTKGYLY